MAYPMFRNRLRPFDVPVRQSPAPPSAGPPSKPSPKVVSIPVHFVSSESKRSTAALRIQKAVRGFLVRKSVKKIVGIKEEGDEIEKRLSERETVDLIRKDGKERLRMNEMLMRLLFRLDSISGVDLGVRVLRKSVTRKVIMLQEKLDSIAVVTADENKESVGEENAMETQKSDIIDMEVVVEPVELNSVSPNANEFESSKNCNEEEGGSVENEKSGFNAMEEEPAEEKKVDEDSVIACNQSQGTQEMEVTEEEGDEKKALMEKMIEKNEMLIKMVSELCDKNRLQTEMLHSLSKRVDSLEKKQRSKCKKRRQAPKNCYDV